MLYRGRKQITAELVNIDKAMRIMVPGTEAIKPTVQPSPPTAGFVKKTYGPREGGKVFEELLKTSTKIFDLVSKAGRNIASMATSMTILVEKEACRMSKLQDLGIRTQDTGPNYLLETTCIADTGADICCASDEMREALGRAPLRDASGKVVGIGGANSSLEKDKLRIVTSDKEVTVVESRRVGNLGVNMNNNMRFNETARLELGTSCEDQRFEWNLQETVPQILLGSLLSHQMTEQEIIDAQLNCPTFSPELQVWKTP